MTRSKAEFVREATCEDWGCRRDGQSLGRCMHGLADIVRVNGHTRLLYQIEDRKHKPFTFPHSYGKGPKAPSDKYNKAKAWAQAYRGVAKAQDVFVNNPKFTAPKCPRCSKQLNVTRYTRDNLIGWTYAACPECNIIFNY